MKYELNRMSWTEAEEQFRKIPIAILPIGTTEQNGPHIPLGNDAIVTEYVARKVAERTGILLLPLIPYGCSQQFRQFPGTVWLRPETLQSVIYDVGHALAEHGCKGLIVANNHGPNHPPAERALRQLMDESAIKTISFWPSRAIKELAGDLYKDTPERLGHGGEPMTSVIMALAGEDVAKDRILDRPFFPSPIGRIKVKNSSVSNFKGCEVNLYLDMKAVTPTGQTGDARFASPEIGWQLINKAIDWAVELVEEFQTEVIK